MARRDLPEVNAGSMADIAFIMLIFFLVSTTLAQEKGYQTILPKWKQPPVTTPVPEWNVLNVQIEDNGELLVEGNQMTVEDLRAEIPIFMLNNGKRKEYSTSYEEAVVSLTTSKDAPYESYLLTFSTIKSGFNDIRNNAALDKYGKSFDELSELENTISQAENIRETYPLRFAEQIQD